MAIDFTKVVERDRGLKQIQRQMKALSNIGGARVEVGFIGSKGSKRHKGNQKAKATVVEIAAFHEFGTKNIPRRSMIGGWAKDRKRAITVAITKTARDLFKNNSLTRSLNRLGTWAQSDIQTRIGRGIPPALADSTKKQRKRPSRKGKRGQSGYTPLIDTGQLRASVSYRIKT